MNAGKLLFVAGLVIAGIGLLMMAGVRFGQLPGDVNYRRDNFSFHFPIVTSIIVSIILTILFSLFRR